MEIQNTKYKILIILALVTLLSGCPLEGDNGNTGNTGNTGETGLSGINCWDLNGDRINDDDEDKNNDGQWDAKDCAVVSMPTQSVDVAFNHQHVCESLANLNEYPQGCPSNTHTVPTGTLTRITLAQLFDDGSNGYDSCNNPPHNGLLSIESRVSLDNPDLETIWFVLEGGYIAKTSTISYPDAIAGVCRNECLADSNCIAALAVQDFSAARCNIFYHSDTVSAYERVCFAGEPVPGFTAGELCRESLLGQARWDAKCP